MPILRSCPVCGTEFSTCEARIKDGRGKHCSKACYWKSLKKLASEWPREYRSFQGAQARCNPVSLHETNKQNYVDRGIKFRFESFKQFLDELGPRPEGLSLDRIDNDGHYEPGNVRWATAADQQKNRRGLNLLSYQGKTQALSEWARELGIDRAVLEYRTKKGGWSVERAFSTPVKTYRNASRSA